MALTALPKLVKQLHDKLAAYSAPDDAAAEGFAQQRQFLADTVSQLNSPDLALKYAFKLVGTGAITPDKEVFDAKEKLRRRDLERLQFRCVLRVNNKVLTRSTVAKLSTDSVDGVVLEIMQSFECRVFNRPSAVALDLVCSSGRIFAYEEVLAGSVRVPIPGRSVSIQGKRLASQLVGDAASGYAPISGWNVFSDRGSTGAGGAVSKEALSGLLRAVGGRASDPLSVSTEVSCSYLRYRMW